MVCEENEQVYKEREDVSSGTVIISFLVGLGIGAIGSYLITRKKMREEKEREIADVTAYYDGLSQETRTIVVDTDEFNDHPRDDLPPEDKPHPIPKDWYTNDMDYHKDTLVYYVKDDILTDMLDNEVCIEDVIGREVLNHFGDDGDKDLAYVRNEKLGMDYEIVLDERPFSSVLGEALEE